MTNNITDIFNTISLSDIEYIDIYTNRLSY